MAMMISGSSNSNSNNNFDALRSLSILNQNRITNQREVQRSSTTRLDINDAIDNVSAYTIAESLRIRTRVLGQANENIQNDTALLRTAQRGGDSIVDSIKEIQRLAISATDESITDDDRRVIQKDINRLVNQISADSQTTFNGKNLIDGSATTGNQAIATVLSNNSLLSGTTANTALTALQNSSGVNLGIEASDRITASYVKDGNIFTTSFSVGTNTLEDIFVNLNMINGVKQTDNNLTVLADPAFAGGGKGIITKPTIRDEPIAPEVKIDPRTPEFERPDRVFSEAPEEVPEPKMLFIPAEDIPVAPEDEEVSSASDALKAAINIFAEKIKENLSLPEDLPEDVREGVEEFISSLQDEMLQPQDDGSIRVLSNWTDSESYQNLSDEEVKAVVDANADAINTAFDELNNSDYADKVNAYNTVNAEYKAAVAQYETDKAAYDKAIQAGATIIYKPEDLDENATPEQQAEYALDSELYSKAVENYSSQAATKYAEDVDAYNNYLTEKDTYDKYVAWQNYDEKHNEYLTYKNEELPAYRADKAKYDEEYAQYQKDMEYYNMMTVDAVQNDSNGLSVTAQKPGLEGQISGISINVTDSSGNTKSVATAALNNFKTTTFAEDEREDHSMNFQIGETVGQTMNFGFNDMRAEAFGLKGANGNIISISTKEDADAALATINNALTKATEHVKTIGSSEKRLGYIADSLAIEIGNIQEPDLMIRNADMAKTLTLYSLDIFHRDRMQSMFAMANQHASSVLALLR